MAWYRSGTVALTNGNTEVVGTGTQFLNNVKAGDIFIGPDGLLYEIASVNTSTGIILQIGYAGASVNGATYEIVPTTINLKQLAQRVADLIALYNEIPQDVSASQDAAAASAAAAAASRTSAATSETNAASSATSASTAAAQLAAALLTFNKLWLGPHTSDPTTDNNGEALQEGAMYENTSTTPAKIRIYHNGQWQGYSADAEAATAAAQLSAANAAASESNAASSASAATVSATAAAGSASAAAQSAQVAQNATDGKMDKSANLSDVAAVSTARRNLGAAASGKNSDITELTGLTTALSVGQGGTGLSSQGAAGQVLTSGGTGLPMLWTNPADLTALRLKNRIINSDCSRMDTPVQLRTGTEAYGPVNFRQSYTKGAFAMSQGTLTYNGVTYNTARCTCTALPPTLGTDDYYTGAITTIEGLLSYDLNNSAFVVAGVINVSVAGNYAVTVRDAASGTSVKGFTFMVTVAAAGTPQFFSKAIPATTLTIPRSSTARCVLTIGAVTGGSYRGTPDSWSTGNNFSSATQTAWATAVNNFVEITLLHVEKGASFTGFEIIPPWLNDQMCDRYSQIVNAVSMAALGRGAGVDIYRCSTALRVPMRATPLVQSNLAANNFSGPAAPNADQWTYVQSFITYVELAAPSPVQIAATPTVCYMITQHATPSNSRTADAIAIGTNLYILLTAYL